MSTMSPISATTCALFNEASTQNDPTKIKSLIEAKGDVNLQIAGFTALHLASKGKGENAPKAIRLLVEANASVDEPLNCLSSELKGMTPLHIAIKKGLTENIKVLLNLGATPDARSLSIAKKLKSGEEEVCNLLLARQEENSSIPNNNSSGDLSAPLLLKKTF